MSKINIYGVFRNGEKVFEGSIEEVAKKYDIKVNRIPNLTIRKSKLFGVYDIVILQKIARSVYLEGKKPKIIEPSKEEKDMNHLLTFLKMHGNVASDFNPETYLPKLKELGFNCRVRRIVDKKKDKVSGKHRGEDVWYVTEVV